ncbi:ester cyclase [Paraburkholderia phytofirmans]|uniref:ester cyclase n=1 Tax=Paraburkholderia phytofirmans TaxID=261302 RepID=UPI0038BCC15B
MSIDEIRERREQLVRHHMRVENDGDADAVVQTFHRPHYDLVAPSVVFDGADAVRRRVQMLAEAMPDARVEATHIHHSDSAVIVETTTTGTHTGNLMDIAPNGRPFEIRGVAIFLFEEDRLVGERVYYDRQTLLDQIKE